MNWRGKWHISCLKPRVWTHKSAALFLHLVLGLGLHHYSPWGNLWGAWGHQCVPRPGLWWSHWRPEPDHHRWHPPLLWLPAHGWRTRESGAPSTGEKKNKAPYCYIQRGLIAHYFGEEPCTRNLGTEHFTQCTGWKLPACLQPVCHTGPSGMASSFFLECRPQLAGCKHSGVLSLCPQSGPEMDLSYWDSGLRGPVVSHSCCAEQERNANRPNLAFTTIEVDHFLPIFSCK